MQALEKEKVVKETSELLASNDAVHQFIKLLIDGMNEEEVRLLARQLELAKQAEPAERQRQVAELLGVRNYSDDERIAFQLASLLTYFTYRRKLLATALTAPQVAEALGTTRQTPHDRLKAGLLLGILDNGAWKFPDWQFDANGPNGVIDGLPEVVAALKVPILSKISWLSTPNATFDNLTPVEVLRQPGRKDEVIQEALSVGVS